MKQIDERGASRGILARAACLGGLGLAVIMGAGSGGAAQQTEQCGYLGQAPPGTAPQVFAPGIVSTDAHEFAVSMTPDGREFYFTRRETRDGPTRIMFTRCVDGVWTHPEAAPFNEDSEARPYSMSFEPRVTPDGSRLYFSSDRPLPDQSDPEAGPMFNIWYVDREADHWSAPRAAEAPFNPMKSMFISMSTDGTIYTTDISDGLGRERLAVAIPSRGRYRRLERLEAWWSTEGGDIYPHIAPDESYLIWKRRVATGPTLFISFRDSGGSWSEPRPLHLGLPRAGTPFVSWDGRYLFFTAGGRSEGDIYWVDASRFLPPDGR